MVEDAGLNYFVEEIFTKEEVVEERDMGDPLSLITILCQESRNHNMGGSLYGSNKIF